ncbi:hypothetical protein ACH4SP_19885 [Streptomyces sp. NPDC021093]|uniref:hypothetical protein n=1 Tax=Streptomyces sp. NPDC021093 TaxID=3365112 RepID=UPI0037AA616B
MKDRPVKDRPVTDRPVTDRPVTDRPVTDRPVTATAPTSPTAPTSNERFASMIQRVGFFREFTHDEATATPSIHDAVGTHALYDEAGIVAYLESGAEIFTAMGADRDVVSGDEWVPSGSLSTDGKWLWPGELAHYVRRYHLELPADFLTDVRAAQYAPPALPPGRGAEIYGEVFGGSPQGPQERPEGGFFAWYLTALAPEGAARLLALLAEAGLQHRHRLTDSVYLTRREKGAAAEVPVADGQDPAAVLAAPGDGEVTLHLRFEGDTAVALRVRRLDPETVTAVFDLVDLAGPEREQAVAGLVRVLDAFRDDCRGFVLDRTGRSARGDWDGLYRDGTWPPAPFPDSVAVGAERGGRPTGSAPVAPASYGRLTVFNRTAPQ